MTRLAASRRLTRRRTSPLRWLYTLTGGALWAAAAWVAGSGGCGGRTELEIPPPLPPQPECDTDDDCPGFDDLCGPATCVDTEENQETLPELPAGVLLPPRVCLVVVARSCDDGDPCTEDTCDPETGACEHGPVTLDADGDGFRAPIPGKRAGEDGSCGDDCNDASPLAFPGNEELCDGVDNDCNGIVDDGAEFVPLDGAPARISGPIAPSGPGGLAFNGSSYLAIYTGNAQGFDMYATGLDAQGNKIAPFEERVALQNADSSGGPVVWIGDRYGLAWQDRRDGNYEAYFTLLDEAGEKVLADVRLSNAAGFSVNVQLAWTGSEFVVVWQDDQLGAFEIVARRVSVDGVPLGDNVRLSTDAGLGDESPVVATGTSTVGVAYATGVVGDQRIRLQTFTREALEPVSELVDITDGTTEAVYPEIVWNQDHYLVAWYDRSAPVKAIYAARIGEDGTVLTAPTPLSAPGSFRSRYPALMPLGDRAVVIYADDRDGNDGYELYSRMINADLSPLGGEQRLTDAPFDSIYPVAAFGPEGTLGILFRDDRENGEHHVWFTRLGCVTAP